MTADISLIILSYVVRNISGRVYFNEESYIFLDRKICPFSLTRGEEEGVENPKI